MAMELEFYESDGPNGEKLQFAVPVQAWNIIANFERFRNPKTVVIILTHTSRQRGAWISWVKPGYTSGTHPSVGKLIESKGNDHVGD